MKERVYENKRKPLTPSRDAGIIVGVSLVLSMVALVAFVATLPA